MRQHFAVQRQLGETDTWENLVRFFDNDNPDSASAQGSASTFAYERSKQFPSEILQVIQVLEETGR